MIVPLLPTSPKETVDVTTAPAVLSSVLVRFVTTGATRIVWFVSTATGWVKVIVEPLTPLLATCR